ncbi:unnamed protein product, partial [Ectocarpus sp. 12 AP-2014]
QIIACYRANNHPYVRRGEKVSAAVQQDFLHTLSDITSTELHNSHGTMVSFPAFLDFYCSLTAFTSDTDFRDAIVAVWVPPVVQDNNHVLHTLGAAGGLVANLRSQILTNGLPGVAAFCRGVRKAARGSNGGVEEITQGAFRAAASSAGAALTASEMSQAFRHLDRRGVGKICVADALRAVRGEVSKRRAQVIDEVFDSLLFRLGGDSDAGDGQHSHTLEPVTVARLYRAEAHPDVVSGVRTQAEVLSEFLEAFEAGGGEIDGRVTRGEWREHHLQVSATMADDDLFCEHMKCVWGYGNKEKNILEASHVNNHDLTASTNSNNCNTAIRGPNGAHGSVEQGDGNSVSSKSNGDGRQRGGEAGRNSPFAAREAWVPSPPTASNAERGPILHQGSARDAAAARLSPGVLGLLARARGSLASGGMRAAFQLLKGFREEDKGGDGKVTLSGLKKAIGGAALGLGLKEAEMRIIFQHFDKEGDGQVPYDLFLRHIRTTLPDGRLALAHQVFDRMDTDGDGLVFVDDVARTFRAGAHPEVVEGSRTEEDVRREFLESFSVTDGSHKWCTRDDLIWWMELLSSSLPNATPPANYDLQFERVARACWGIPANAPGVPGSQQGGAFDEAPQSVSVVVTHADGSITMERVSRQEVEVHPNGSGTHLISEAQAEKIRRQLSRRGVHAVHVHLLNEQKGTVHASPEAAGSSEEAADVKHVGSILEGSSCSCPHGVRQLSADEVRTARLGPSGHGQGSRGGDCFWEGEANLGFDHGMLSVLHMARRQLALRGPVGFLALSKRLRSAAYFRSKAAPSSHPAFVAAAAAAAAASMANGSSGVAATDRNTGPFLSLGAFKDALSEVNCGLTGKDLTCVFTHLDDAGRGEVLVDVVLEAFRGHLTGARLALVRAAFTRLRGSGDAPPDAAAAVNVAFQFDPRGHPDVIAGRRSPEDVRTDFMDALTTTKGFVTRKDFESYYTDISAATPSDAYFSLQIQACWGLGRAAIDSTAAFADANTAPHSGTGAPAGEHTAGLGRDFDPCKSRRTYSKARTSAAPGVLPGTAERGDKVAAVAVRQGDQSGMRTPTAGVAAILRKLGKEVQGHGAAWGLAGLRRALFDADRNKGGFLSFGDLKAALSSSRAGLTVPEVRALFTHLETEGGPRRAGGGGGDGSGVVPWQALLDATRPPLSGERLGLVRLAFGKMDKEGRGHVSPETVTQRFVGSRHPAVLRGRATAEEVRQELLDTFFSAGASEPTAKEEQVSEKDFIEHHANLSFGIKRDEDFRELVINCWGLDGGGVGGGDACMPADVADMLRRVNTPRRKFLVSYADGSQRVEELPFSSKGPEQREAEGSLTAAEERVLKRELLIRDDIHATQVTLLPRTYSEEGGPHSAPESSLASAQENPAAVDRRPAWTWAPMNLSEVQDAAAAAANAAAPESSLHEETGNQHDQSGLHGSLDSSDGAGKEDDKRPVVGDSNEFDATEVVEVDWEGEEGDGGGAGGRARQRMRAGGRRMQAGEGREADLSMIYLLSKLRSELHASGISGMANLMRRLREAAVLLEIKGKESCYGVGEVDLRRALREANLPLTEPDIRRIFSHFEMGQSGVMNLGALMDRLSGCMGNGRVVLVDEAFDRLDTSGQGHLTLDKVIDSFDATKHPAVVSGRKTPDSVFRDFVDGFIAGFPPEKRDGARVTKEDFRRHYDVISATVPDDGYFELLLRSCWRTRGPSGVAGVANTQDGSFAPPGGYARSDEGSNERNPPNQARDNGQQETKRRHYHGQSRRQFQASGDTTKGDSPRTGNDLYGSAPLPPPPNEGREGSFNSLRESRAAGSGLGGRSSIGPSDQNRLLRSAVLSRTFDSQILFGSTNEEDHDSIGRFQRPGAAEGDDAGKPPPPPAGGGRVGRVAEGAAWTPGGRRLIPGSKAFASHLSSGMLTKNEPGAEDDYRTNNASKELVSARKSRAAAAARKPPVWVPKPDPKSSRPVAAGNCHLSAQKCGKVANDGRGALAGAAGKSPYDSISLAQLMSRNKKTNPGQGKKDCRADGSVSSDSGHATASTRTAVESHQSSILGEEHQERRISERPSARGIIGRGGGGAFDWWGGASALDTGSESARDRKRGMVGGSRNFIPQPQTVSDTYKSSLILG